MIDLNDVLLAMSNIPVDDPIAEIWGRGLQGGYKIIEYTGSLPITINANGDVLLDYRIYGASGGVGEPTENLFDINSLYSTVVVQGQTFTKPQSAFYFDVFSGTSGLSTPMNLQKSIPVTSGTYMLSSEESETNIAVVFSDGETQTVIFSSSIVTPQAFNVPSDGYISIRCANTNVCSVKKLQIIKASTAPASYIPYGYKLPMTVQSANLWNPNSRTNNQVGQLSWGVVLPAGTYTIKNDSNVTVYFRDGIDTTTAQRFANAGETGTKTAINELVAWCNSSQSAIMLNRGSTSISYEPYFHTYVPVYIGDTKLAKDEYVDYGSGKIYRRNPGNYFDGYFELGAIDYNTGDEIPSGSSIRTEFIELEPSNRYYIKWKTGNLYIMPVSYDENKNYVRYLGAKSQNPSFFDLGANEKYIRFCLYNTLASPKEMMVCKNANAPYLQPTDPPVPLPDIPTIDGTTIIDYDGAPKPSQMYVKYKGKG